MGRKITAPVIFEAGPLFAGGRPGNLGADSVAIALHTLEFETEPIVSLRGIIFKQQRSCPLLPTRTSSARHCRSPHRKPRARRISGKRVPPVADVVQFVVVPLVKQKQRLRYFTCME